MIKDIFNVIISLPSQHIYSGIISSILCIAGTWFYNKSTGRIKSLIIHLIGYIVILNELMFQIYMLYYGIWSLQSSLPLEMCYLTALFIPFYAKNQSSRLLKTWFFFAGFGGSLVAFINTNLSDVEHICAFIHYFFAHGIVIYVMFIIVADGYLPEWKDYFQAIKWTTYLVISVIVVNIILGSNYMFTFEKPSGTNFTLLMPDWPYYFLIMLFIGICLYTLMMSISELVKIRKLS
ncbi:MAG: TIGR02206 family membrane protein [Candidatus Marinimicrobia bacterium]|nr:TIGR02206 family membrane protein [Candidatus Neomarinimicrobiota bacterium]